MSAVRVDPGVIAHVEAHGRDAHPSECCGFLFGRLGTDGKTVVRAQRVDNSFEADERHHRFLITPEDFLRAEKQARAWRLDLVGFYHSHPDCPAVPSAYDLEHSWPVYSYFITSVHADGPRETRSWVQREDRSAFDEEQLEAVPGLDEET